MEFKWILKTCLNQINIGLKCSNLDRYTEVKERRDKTKQGIIITGFSNSWFYFFRSLSEIFMVKLIIRRTIVYCYKWSEIMWISMCVFFNILAFFVNKHVFDYFFMNFSNCFHHWKKSALTKNTEIFEREKGRITLFWSILYPLELALCIIKFCN